MTFYKCHGLGKFQVRSSDFQETSWCTDSFGHSDNGYFRLNVVESLSVSALASLHYPLLKKHPSCQPVAKTAQPL